LRILLDNCVDRRLARLLTGHEVSHTSRVGLSAVSNGLLLKSAAEQGFEVLITVDQKIRYEHNLEMLPVAVLELDTRDSRLGALQEMAGHFERALDATRDHRFVSLSHNGDVSCLAPRLS